MKTFYKIALGLMVLACSIFSCKNDWLALPGPKNHPSSSVYGSVTTVRTGLYNLGPIAVDKAHNFYYIQHDTGPYDTSGIRKVTPAGVTSFLAGGGQGLPSDGIGADARFGDLNGITLGWDSALYVTEGRYGVVRKVTLKGVVTSIGPYFWFTQAQGLKLGTDGNLYVAQGPISNTVSVVKPSGTIYTLAGDGFFGYQDGPAASAEFLWPRDLAIRHDSTVFVADWGNNVIRKIKNGIVSTDKTGIAGYSLLFDSSGNLYIGEASKITKITPNGVVSTLAGSSTQGSADGIGSAATFSGPLFLAIDKDVLYVADCGNNSIRKVVIK